MVDYPSHASLIGRNGSSRRVGLAIRGTFSCVMSASVIETDGTLLILCVVLAKKTSLSTSLILDPENRRVYGNSRPNFSPADKRNIGAVPNPSP